MSKSNQLGKSEVYIEIFGRKPLTYVEVDSIIVIVEKVWLDYQRTNKNKDLKYQE
jgi:hypothetical protein